MRETITKGIYIGLILIVSSILTLRFTNDIESTIKVFNYFIPILIGYILIGLVLQWIRTLPHKESEGSIGVGSYYWIFLIMTGVSILGGFVPDYLRYIVLVNILVIVGLWFIDYYSLKLVAKELNGSSSYKYNTIMVDLAAKPKNKEEFFIELEKYCGENKILLEYIEKDLPAIVKLDGVLNRVQIGYYYALTGEAIYVLKISEL